MCQAAVGVTGDICRALGSKVLPSCDEIMMMLLENLSVSIHIIIRINDINKLTAGFGWENGSFKL